MRILAIDPGSEESGYVLYEDKKILGMGIVPNRRIADSTFWADEVVIEQVEHYGTGMPVGKTVFDTVFWAGRFAEARYRQGNKEAHLLPRRAVKLHLCGSCKAKDSNIRQAIIDRYGGNTVAIGNKKCPQCKGKGWFGAGRPTCPRCKGAKWKYPPGPLSEIVEDMWSALALAITFAENNNHK